MEDKKLIVANWKCNPVTLKEARELFVGVRDGIKKTKNEVVICPPYPYISYMVNSKSEIRNPQLGAQDCFWEEKGPYTGEVSPQMLKSLGVEYVIVGHSERRISFNETDEMINKKLKAVLNAELIPILCIGEKKRENAKEVIENQLKSNLQEISEKDLKKIIIAYEPVWAIGTGDFCEADKAKKILEFIKNKLNNKILYGGSVNSEIAKNYTDVGFDGLLVGGASLQADKFIKIVKNVRD
jgi:triosephosphate isomerase